MTYVVALLACTTALHSLLLQCSAVQVNSSHGPVLGLEVAGPNGSSVHVFYGIPYAKPPVGKLRFKFPQPADPWTSVLNATQKPNSCFQVYDTMDLHGFPAEAVNMWNPNTNLSEDCLYLNFWTPAQRNESLLPVLVWIYGGGFATGTSTLDIYDGKVLAATENVVVASMQYRLNALGFLYLDSPDAPGNAGLADQQLALQWIHANAKAFGGDPQKITIFGESAGAVSVNYQLLINYNKQPQLFRSAVIQSATVLGSWAYVSPDQMLQRSKTLEMCLGCYNNATCLQFANIQALLSCQPQVARSHVFQLNFVATRDYHGLLSDSPAQLLLDGKHMKVPLMMGLCQNEGSYFLLYSVNSSLINYSCSPDATAAVFHKYLRHILYGDPNIEDSEMASVADRVSREYQSYAVDQSNSSCLIDNLLSIAEQVLGDTAFKCPTLEVARWYAEAEMPVYFYLFRHRTSTNPWPAWTGVLHADEIEYTFGVPLVRTKKFTHEERQLSSLLLASWANFARTGNPSVPGRLHWPLFSKSSNKYVYLDSATATGDAQYDVDMRQAACKLHANLSMFNHLGLQRAPASSPASTVNEHWQIVLCLCVFVIALVQ